jgi:hypothetical protein
MTDPQNPDVPARPPEYDQPPAYDTTPPPAAAQPAGQQGYAQPAYSTAPPPPYGAPPATPTIPGKTMGIVAFILSFFVQLVALILGIIALVQSKKAGYKNGWAVAAIIISSVLMVIGIIVGIVLLIGLGAAAAEFARLCAEYGTGVHEINGVEITLTCPS